MKLDGKATIVTGGGRGIGRAIALRFAAEGAAVIVSGTTKESIDAVAEEIRERGGQSLALVADVADESQVEHMISATLSKFGGIDILVNNAGIAGPTALVPELSREDWDRTLAINLTGA